MRVEQNEYPDALSRTPIPFGRLGVTHNPQRQESPRCVMVRIDFLRGGAY